MYGNNKNNILTRRSIPEGRDDYGRYNNRFDYSKPNLDNLDNSLKSKNIKDDYKAPIQRKKKQSYIQHDDYDESIDESIIEKQKNNELITELRNLRTNYDELKQKYDDLLTINKGQANQLSLLETAIRTIEKFKQDNDDLEKRLILLEEKLSSVNQLKMEVKTEVKEEKEEKQEIIKDTKNVALALPIIK